MIKFLDLAGLTALWNKIKSTFYTKSELSDIVAHEEAITVSGSPVYNNEAYVKPSGGIPKTDLASAVQTSLDNGDNANSIITENNIKQPYTDNYLTTQTETVARLYIRFEVNKYNEYEKTNVLYGFGTQLAYIYKNKIRNIDLILDYNDSIYNGMDVIRISTDYFDQKPEPSGSVVYKGSKIIYNTNIHQVPFFIAEAICSFNATVTNIGDDEPIININTDPNSTIEVKKVYKLSAPIMYGATNTSTIINNGIGTILDPITYIDCDLEDTSDSESFCGSLIFTTGNTFTTIEIGNSHDTVLFANGAGVEANKTYEMNILAYWNFNGASRTILVSVVEFKTLSNS